jgi:hypothetical protein
VKDLAPLRIPNFEPARRSVLGGMVVSAVGIALLLVGMFVDRAQVFFSYLAAYAFYVSVALGTLIFLMIGHAMHAKWPIVLQRITESLAWTLLLWSVLFVPIAAGLGDVYIWSLETTGNAHLDELIHHKRPYLNAPFFILRAVIYFGIWIFSVALLRRWSFRQDQSAEPMLKHRQHVLSAAALPAVALTLTFAAFDWLMSLTPQWYSTMFGPYYFSGGFLGAIALLIVVARWAAERDDVLKGLVSDSHFYALGRLLLAFTIFWGYIAFFQAFIIYTANKPEEVAWYVARLFGSWSAIGVLLVIGHFALPFLVLLSYRLKRRPRLLAAVALWILAMHYVDVYWLVLPVLHDELTPHWLDLAALLALGGAAWAFALLSLRGKPVAPRRDPDLAASAAYESR